MATHGGEVDPRLADLRARLRAMAVSATPRLPANLTATLRPYQAQGLAWLQFVRDLGAGGVLADDMGLGKTITTLAFLAEAKERDGAAPSLVVCPTSVCGNWMNEAQRFTPGLRTLLFHGSAREAKLARAGDYDLLVTTYGVLRRAEERLAAIKLRAAILDEAQNIKNADAATTHAAKALDAQVRLALTGTPVENRLRELWSLLDFANPGMLGSATRFEERFERPIAADPRCEATSLLRAIVRPFVLRRSKEQVLTELPPKTEIDRACVLTPAQKKLYDALAHTLRADVKKSIAANGLAASRFSVLTAILRLRQMACDPRLVDWTQHDSVGAKRAQFLTLVRELVAEGRRALVFSQFVELFRLWRRDLDAEGIDYEYLDGQTRKRDMVVARFQDGDAPLFLLSLKAGGAGLNLTAADTVIHCDPWWNPAVEDQATDRAHRLGQERPVTVVRLVAQGTIEEKIGALKQKKRELAEAVIGGDGYGALAGLTKDDIDLLLGDVEGEVDREEA
jgi:SNF2 family DNA or RNA helicase